MLEPDGVLLIRQTSSESLPVSFLCTSAKVAEFCSSTESTTLVELGTIAGVAQVAGANVRVRLMDGKRIVIDGSTNWLVKLKFVLEKESSIS